MSAIVAGSTHALRGLRVCEDFVAAASSRRLHIDISRIRGGWKPPLRWLRPFDSQPLRACHPGMLELQTDRRRPRLSPIERPVRRIRDELADAEDAGADLMQLAILFGARAALDPRQQRRRLRQLQRPFPGDVHVDGLAADVVRAEGRSVRQIEEFDHIERGLPRLFEIAMVPLDDEVRALGNVFGVQPFVGGLLTFGPLAVRWGRRRAFLAMQAAAVVVVAATCYLPTTYGQLLALLPVYGFCTLGLHAGFAIYFPELFPTSLRATGAGFCFNGGRLIAAPILVFSGTLKARLGDDLRLAIVLLSSLFVAGMLFVWMLPETKDQPLPDDSV